MREATSRRIVHDLRGGRRKPDDTFRVEGTVSSARTIRENSCLQEMAGM